MRRYHAPNRSDNDLVPVRTSRVLFDATQPNRPQPAFGRRGVNVQSRYVPGYRSPASIADELWAAREFNQPRVAEAVWDSDTVDESRAEEAAYADKLLAMSL